MKNIFTPSKNHKYGNVTRSTFRNLLFSMLSFGLIIGIIFPFFARLVLNTEKALSPSFILMCIGAGLIVGLFNFLIFRIVVSRELIRVQQGMIHVNENIQSANISGEECENYCALEVTSADIIGDITLAFNSMTEEIFNRLDLESETKSLNEKLIKSVELEDVAINILMSMGRLMDAKGGLLYGGSSEKMSLLADFGVDRSTLSHEIDQEESGPINHTLMSGEIQLFTKIDGWKWFSQTTPLGTFKPESIILIPLLTKHKPVGLVMLASGIKKLDEKQMKKIKALCAFAAPYLDNSILHRKITELAAIDDLTMIMNRRFGMKRLKEEFSRSTRHGTPLSVMMVDIDHFKDFNDTFGHNAGDAVLKVVASILNSNLRAEDMVCRYGGEEFLLFLSGAGLIDCAITAERIRRVIEAETIKWGSSSLSVTVSIGIATYPIVRASVCEELVTYADKALYIAKESGRNQVVANDGNKNIPYAEMEIIKQGNEKADNA